QEENKSTNSKVVESMDSFFMVEKLRFLLLNNKHLAKHPPFTCVRKKKRLYLLNSGKVLQYLF
ncbi:MAG TPA: hypothetical protein PKO30_13630, partial [Prolixibacteraceae bacterium]|nr:hypothetical protein [Prolixibacteraceae bacterium]